MSCGRNEIAMRDGRRMKSGSNQTGNMGNVGSHQCFDGAADCSYTLEVYDARVGACAADDHLRLMFVRQFFERVIIYRLSLFIDSIGCDVEVLAGEVERVTMREVSPVREIHAENSISRLKSRHKDAHIGLSAGMGLNIDVI